MAKKALKKKPRKAKRSNELIIKTKRQWESISSPTRASIIECLFAIGPSSIKEIAASIGRSAELVHHHMPMLLEAGFVVEQEPRQLPKHTERVFAESGLKWVFDTQSDPDTFVEGITKMGRAWSRANERLLERAFKGKDPSEFPQLLKQITFRSESAFLEPSAEKEVRKHLEAIKEVFQKERASNKGVHQTIYWSLVPVDNNP